MSGRKKNNRADLEYHSPAPSQDDSLQDSAAVQFEYFIDDTSEATSCDISKHLGHYSYSATKDFISARQSATILFAFFSSLLFFVLRPEVAITTFLLLGTVIHFTLTTIKQFLFTLKRKVVSLRQNYIEAINKPRPTMTAHKNDLPLYSILLPVFMEGKAVLQQLFEAIYNIDYPKEKMQVLLLLEEVDGNTIQAAKSIKTPLDYELIIVPDFAPRTKAKACNYGLNFIRGEYVVIFDADDIPAVDQLHKSIRQFRAKDDAKLACLQAKLNYYNADENLLTRLFSLEYAILFDKILPSLSSLNYPLPLGGTSNHFRADVLRELRGWDIYNLAEDAEIGMRLAKHGYRTEVVDSYTAEESPITLVAWIKQRSRWLKGFMQTYFLYLQKKNAFSSRVGRKQSFVSLHCMLGLSTLSLIITPLMLACSYILVSKNSISIDNETSKTLLCLSTLSASFWIVSSLFQSVKLLNSSAFLKDLSPTKKIITALAFPSYFVLHSIAALYAIVDLIRRPFYWSKTAHGLAKTKSKKSLGQ